MKCNHNYTPMFLNVVLRCITKMYFFWLKLTCYTVMHRGSAWTMLKPFQLQKTQHILLFCSRAASAEKLIWPLILLIPLWIMSHSMMKLYLINIPICIFSLCTLDYSSSTNALLFVSKAILTCIIYLYTFRKWYNCTAFSLCVQPIMVCMYAPKLFCVTFITISRAIFCLVLEKMSQLS